jgi:hypothetical protein
MAKSTSKGPTAARTIASRTTVIRGQRVTVTIATQPAKITPKSAPKTSVKAKAPTGGKK